MYDFYKLFNDIPWEKVSEFFSEIDQRIPIYAQRAFIKYFYFDEEVENEIKKSNSEIQNNSLEETLLKLKLEYTNDFTQLSPYNFQTDINSSTKQVIFSIKSNLKTQNSTFYIMCNDKERLYRFALNGEKNIIALIEAKTAYTNVTKKNIPPQLIVGSPGTVSGLYYLSNIDRKIKNNFTDWYIFSFEEELLFMHREGKAGSALGEDIPKIKLTDFNEYNKCEIL